jgi:hypothetical protein
MVRAIDVDAPAEVVFRWLCQLRVAPYSYDWIANLGRKSPPRLTPGLDELEVGQTVMRIFELVELEYGRHITVRTKDARALGQIVVSYVVQPVAGDSCRLIVKLAIRYPRSLRGALLRRTLPWGDLIMMRKQLHTLKRYAERSRSR